MCTLNSHSNLPFINRYKIFNSTKLNKLDSNRINSDRNYPPYAGVTNVITNFNSTNFNKTNQKISVRTVKDFHLKNKLQGYSRLMNKNNSFYKMKKVKNGSKLLK